MKTIFNILFLFFTINCISQPVAYNTNPQQYDNNCIWYKECQIQRAINAGAYLPPSGFNVNGSSAPQQYDPRCIWYKLAQIDTNLINNPSINYLNDTIGGNGSKPCLATLRYINSILSSYLTIADSSFMSSKTFMESYVANHAGTLNANDTNYGSGHIGAISQLVTTYSTNVNSLVGSNINIPVLVHSGDYTGNQYILKIGNYPVFDLTLDFVSSGSSLNIGYQSSFGYSPLYGNISIGSGAGASITTGSYILCLGNNANVGSGTLTNCGALGCQAVVRNSNTYVVGNTSVTNFGLGGGVYNETWISASINSGSVTIGNYQVTSLSGTGTTVAITEPSSPQTGQTFVITTSKGTLALTWVNSSNFVAPPSTITNVLGHKFVYNGAQWENEF